MPTAPLPRGCLRYWRHPPERAVFSRSVLARVLNGNRLGLVRPFYFYYTTGLVSCQHSWGEEDSRCCLQTFSTNATILSKTSLFM